MVALLVLPFVIELPRRSRASYYRFQREEILDFAGLAKSADPPIAWEIAFTLYL